MLPLLDACLDQVRALPDAAPGATELQERVASLVEFTHRFDHAVDIVVQLDSADIGRLFELLDQIPDERLETLLRTVATRCLLDDAVAAARSWSRACRPGASAGSWGWPVNRPWRRCWADAGTRSLTNGPLTTWLRGHASADVGASSSPVPGRLSQGAPPRVPLRGRLSQGAAPRMRAYRRGKLRVDVLARPRGSLRAVPAVGLPRIWAC
ncbi:MAG: hypothetical protein U0667_09135 [Chloroflexota bacterium]